MKKLFVLLVGLLVFFSIPAHALAIVDPLSVPNNKIGIHILFDNELPDASQLVNANGDWGYVTIPIQSGDKDLDKWQTFMDQCKSLHIIPIVRLATNGDYFTQGSWRKPTYDDVIDFANFLNSLDWPTKNRYVIVYNEVNRGDEWGGSPDPAEYADILSFAVSAFKTLNNDFFIISSGMDNASANGNNAINEYTYMRQMDAEVPGIFSQVDGVASHSYPNPAFKQPPTIKGPMSISSFKYEEALAEQLDGKKLPVFITETGWVDSATSPDQIASYYQQAFSTVWNDPNIVAVTPFLLRAGDGPFKSFSFISPDGSHSKEYDAIKNLAKVKGQPEISLPDHNAQLIAAPSTSSFPEMNFGKDPKFNKNGVHLSYVLTTAFHWMFKL